jgi:O-antigen/teichoic acid export membrane protein
MIKPISILLSVFKRELFKDSLQSLICSLLHKATAITQGIIIARLVSIEEYGIWGLMQSFLGLSYTLSNFGVNRLINKYTAKYCFDFPVLLGEIMGITRLLIISISSIYICVSYIWIYTSSDAILSQVVKENSVILIVILCLSLLESESIGILQGLGSFRKLMKLQFVISLLSIAGSIMLVSAYGIQGALVVMTVSSSISYFVLRKISVNELSHYGVKRSFTIKRANIVLILRDAIPYTLSALLVPASALISRHYISLNVNGLAILSFVLIGTQCQIAIQLVSSYINEPLFNRMIRTAHLSNYYFGISIAIPAIIGVLLCIPFALCPELLCSVFGIKYQSELLYQSVSISMLGTFFSLLYVPLSRHLLFWDKSILLVAASFIQCSVFLCMQLSTEFGKTATGVLLSSTIGFFAQFVFGTCAIIKYYPELKYAILSLPMIFIYVIMMFLFIQIVYFGFRSLVCFEMPLTLAVCLFLLKYQIKLLRNGVQVHI